MWPFSQVKERPEIDPSDQYLLGHGVRLDQLAYLTTSARRLLAESLRAALTGLNLLTYHKRRAAKATLIRMVLTAVENAKPPADRLQVPQGLARSLHALECETSAVKLAINGMCAVMSAEASDQL